MGYWGTQADSWRIISHCRVVDKTRGCAKNNVGGNRPGKRVEHLVSKSTSSTSTTYPTNEKPNHSSSQYSKEWTTSAQRQTEAEFAGTH
jgi:hypothetical protein